MSYWRANKKSVEPLINAFEKHIIACGGIILVDGGAAGELQPPFDVCKKLLTTIRFEPRGKDKVLLNNRDIYVDGGIWSNDDFLELHVAKVPTTSSILPPNENYLSKFDTINTSVRETVRKVQVSVRSIDSCVANREIPPPDFIKLDVHSSELPALLGAINNIDNCLGLMVETWNSPVHSNQGLHFEIEKFAFDHGFELYDQYCAARWKHMHRESVDRFDRSQHVGTEVLFFRSKVFSSEQTIKLAFLLVLFGYAEQAKNHLFELQDSKIRDELIAGIIEFQRRRSRSFELILKLFVYEFSTLLGGFRGFFRKVFLSK